MSESSDYGGLDVFALSDRSPCGWRDSPNDGRQRLLGNQEFARLEYAIKRNNFSRIGQPMHSLIPKRRCYAYQSI